MLRRCKSRDQSAQLRSSTARTVDVGGAMVTFLETTDAGPASELLIGHMGAAVKVVATASDPH